MVKPMALVGVILLLAGLVFFVYPALSFKKTDKVLDLGGLEVTREKTERIPIPPIAAGVAVVAGLALVVAARR